MRKYVVPVVLVALVAVFAVLVGRDLANESDGERALRKDSVFPAWRRDRIVSIALETGASKVRLDRDPVKNTWTLHDSADAPDQARADLLLAELEQATFVRKVDPDPSLGLDVARVRVRIGMGDLEYVAALGRAAPKPEGASYLSVEGGGAYVVEKRLADALLVPPAEYRDKRLVPGNDPPAVVRVALPGAAPFSIVRDGKTRHRLDDGGPFASRAAATELASALAELRAVRFLSDGEGARAIEAGPPFLSVTTERGTATFARGGPCPGAPDDVVVARTSAPPVYACVAKGTVATLSRPREAYLERRAFFARVDEVEEIALERPGRPTVDLARKGSGFRLRAPGEGRDLDSDGSDGIRAWLGSLLALEGEPTEAKGAPFATVTLVYGGTKEVVSVVDTKSELVAIGADRRGLALPALARRIVSPPTAFSRGTRLVPAGRTASALELRCGGLVQKVERKKGLAFVPPAPFDLDVALAGQAFSTVLAARAEAWVSDTREGFVPQKPPCTATLFFDDDAGPNAIGIELSAPSGDRAFGSLVGSSEVFVAEPALVAALGRPLASRAPFAVDADAAYELTVFDGLGVTRVGLDGDGGAGERDLLASLHPLFVVRRGELAPDELDPASPRIVVGLRTDGGPGRDVTIRFGKEATAPEGKVVYAVRDGVPFVFAVGTEPVKKLRALVRKSP